MDLYQIKELGIMANNQQKSDKTTILNLQGSFFHGIMAAVVMLVDLEVDDLFFVQRLQVPNGSKICCFCMFLWFCWVILKRKEARSPDKLLILFWFVLESVIQLFVPSFFASFGWERGRTSMFVCVNSSWIFCRKSGDFSDQPHNLLSSWWKVLEKNTLKTQTTRMCFGFLVLVDSCSQMAILISSLSFKSFQKTNRYVYSGTPKGHLHDGIFQGRRWHTPSLHLGPQENRKVSWQLGGQYHGNLGVLPPQCQPHPRKQQGLLRDY